MMRSGNPVLTSQTFRSVDVSPSDGVMTLEGTVNKTGLTLLITVATAFFVWSRFFMGAPIGVYVMGGMIGGLIVALITVFKKTAAPFTVPLYGALEGLALGGISATFESRFPGIVLNAVGLTFGVAFALLFAYKSRMIQATQNFRLGLTAATGGIMILYLVNLVMGFWGKSIGFIHQSGPIGILFSVFVVGIAAFNLVLDFDFIENGAQLGAPKYLEWYAGFGLLVTLIWLYLEILRLLAKLSSRRD